MVKKKQRAQGKVFSVRLSNEEAKDFESRAETSGLGRSEYMRLCLSGTGASFATEELYGAVETLRQTARVFDRYLDILEELLRACREDGKEESIARIEEEISRAEALMDLSLKAQKQTVNILKRIRRKMSAARRLIDKTV